MDFMCANLRLARDYLLTVPQLFFMFTLFVRNVPEAFFSVFIVNFSIVYVNVPSILNSRTGT